MSDKSIKLDKWMNLGKFDYNFIFCPFSYFFKLANFHLSQFPFIYLTFSWIQFCWIPSFPMSLGLSIARVLLIHYFWKKSKSKFLCFYVSQFPLVHTLAHLFKFICSSLPWIHWRFNWVKLNFVCSNVQLP
jgi:hypothetical protein